MSLTARQRELVRGQLKKVLSSEQFSESEKLQRFLKFVVEKKLAGDLASIKETTIAHEVYGRSAGYDPKNDRIVATEGSRLREKLAKAQHADDPVAFEIPKGAYIPEFRFSRKRSFNPKSWLLGAIVSFATFLAVCWIVSLKHRKPPVIEFTAVPHADCGGPVQTERIAGKITGAKPGQFRLAIYSEGCNGVLYIEPRIDAPFTTINSDGVFDTDVYLGQTYYALLVTPTFSPQSQLTTTPHEGGDIVLVAKVRGKPK